MAFYIERFKDIETKEFEVEIVTPMFIGGSDPKKAELRAPSIKGAMRFWWRAFYGSNDLRDMKKRESEIFGSTEKKAIFNIQVHNITSCEPNLANLPKGKEFIVESRKGKFKLGIIDYLAFGLRDFKTGYSRQHLPEKNKFKIKLVIKDSSYKNEIETSFGLLIQFGGLGAKSRNGFGSLCVPDFGPALYKYETEVKNFSSFSDKTILFNRFSEVNKWTDALSEIGMAYKDARLSVEPKHRYEKRLLIAKPIVQTGNSGERHSKPYFLHVSKLDNGRFKGHILFMPYSYYDPTKRKEYFQTCEKMNQKLLEISGGAE